MDKFEECSLVYSQGPNEDGQHPISEDDARIVRAMIKLFDVFDVNLVKELLGHYKFDFKDVEVADGLEKIIAFLPPNYGFFGKRKFLTIGGQLDVDIAGLAMIDRCSRYDFKLETQVHEIVLNETTSVKGQVPYLEKRVFFETEDARDEEYERLKTILVNYSNITFIQ